MDRVNEVTRDCFNALVQIRNLPEEGLLAPETFHARMTGFLDELFARGSRAGMSDRDVQDIAYAMAALAVLDALTGYERLAIALHDADKISSAYRLNFFSSVLVVVLPLVWSRLLVKAREFEPFAVRILWPAVGFGMFALVVSGGRAGWVAAAISFTMFWFLVARFHQVVLHARHWLGAALWGVLAFVGYGFANGWQFMMARVGLVEEGGRGALSGRLDIWTQVITWIPENWLMGIGPMGYRYVPGALDAHPHSWLLQMLLEVGVVGTLLFTAVAGVVWLRLWALSRAGIYGVGALCSLTAFLIAGLANTSIFNAWWLAFLPVISLIGWRVAWAPKDGRRKGRSSRVLKRSSLLSGGHGA